jgi:hypothetical protein
MSRPEAMVEIPPARLWFGLLTGPILWGIVQQVGYFLVSQGCVWRMEPLTPTGAQIIAVIVAAVSAAITAIAGVVAYRDWRRVSEAPDPLEAHANGRIEFMALGGVFVSLVSLVGLIYFVILVIFLNCARVE